MRPLLFLLVIPTLAAAQTMLATRPSNGLDATSARIRLERAYPRPYALPFEAAAMRLPPAMEIFPGFRRPGEKVDYREAVPAIRVVRPTHRTSTADLGLQDAYDVLFFSEKKVVKIRVRLSVAGGSFADRWAKQLRALFDFQDRDGDGELNPAEADYVFTNKGVQAMINRGFSYPTPTEPGRTFPDFDLDRDGRVNFDEFLTYYRPSAAGLFAAQAQTTYDPYGVKLTGAMFTLLDTNNDGKLAKDELIRVQSLFATQDMDEDECLTATELVPDLMRNPGVPAVPKGSDALHVYPAGRLPDDVAESIVSTYRKDKALSFSKADHPLTDAAFAALDKNKDGQVALTELLAFDKLPPDVELDLVYGAAADAPAVRMRPGLNVLAWAPAFRSPAPGTGLLRVGTQTVRFDVDDLRPRRRAGEPDPNLVTFPATGRDFFTDAEIAGPQNQALRVLFDTIDRDSDGRVTRAEFDGFRAVQQSFTELPLTLVHKAQTPSLFQIMDANGDRRLGVREVRNAWATLMNLEPTAKDAVTRDALKPDGAVRFGRRADVQAAPTANDYFVNGPGQRSPAGPDWFRKLDRNGDGELSRREFPGGTDEFAKWDKNGDGGLTPYEAEAERVARKLPK